MASASRSPRGYFWLRWIVLAGALAGVGAVLLWTWRPPQPVAPGAEVLRRELTLRDGHLHFGATTNLFTGIMIERRSDGSLQYRSVVSNGLLEGLSESWHTNGQRQSEEHFHAGVSDGPRTKWHPNGQKLSEATIRAGKLEGVFRRWDENGALSEEVMMRDGQPDGWSRAFYPSRFLRAEARMEQGQLREQRFWKDGERPASAAETSLTTTNSGT